MSNAEKSRRIREKGKATSKASIAIEARSSKQADAAEAQSVRAG
ncbi:MAG: hypothetical protein QW091_00495 [Candidatus Micrarchaeaceae archaeon]